MGRRGVSEKRCGEIIKQTRRNQIPRKISFTRRHGKKPILQKKVKDYICQG
ncbi:MAG: hypothetical protein F6K58_32410 [Symploca sp. SIO2E9]|nr:hypothetical protein [Symploca sp. SIO2E9]